MMFFRRKGVVRWLIPVAIFAVVGTVLLARGGQEAADPDDDRDEDSPAEEDAADVARSGEPAIRGLRVGEGRLGTTADPLVLHHEIGDFVNGMMSGGPPPDGIPSIDEPEFISADEAGLDPGDKVIGLDYGGVTRAYPHAIMVLHEIVNHKVDGENLAVTYCPLTKTAQGFKSASTTLGVSGRLVNSNLIMYDRDTGSLWPQIGATAIDGERTGETLEEVNLYWTTWERWRERHPDTEVLSTNTGHARDYNRDPYGEYNPAGGYYTSDRTMFPLMADAERYHKKHAVVGARTAERAVFFDMESLAEEGIQRTESFIGVYDRDLDTGYVYEAGGGASFSYDAEANDGRPVVDESTGDRYAPAELPLEQVVAVEAFYFAWNAFYPESEHP